VKVTPQEVRDQSYKQAQSWMWTPDIFYGFTKYTGASTLTASMAVIVGAASLVF